MLRLGIPSEDSQLIRDLDDMLIMDFTYAYITVMTGTSHENLLTRWNMLGYGMVQGHIGDYFNEAGCGGSSMVIHNLFSWLQNSTEAKGVTMSQFYDLYYANLLYDTQEVDLTDCIDDHMVYMNSSMGEYIYWNETDGLPSYPIYRFQDDQYLFAAQKGMVYTPIMELEKDAGNLTVTMSEWMNGEHAATWSADTASDMVTTYTLLDLSSTTGYRVYQDGELLLQQDGGFDTISFNATGGGTFLVETWEPAATIPLNAAYTYYSIGSMYYFTDRSYGDGIVSWIWNFGDGYGSTVQNPTHKFKDTGSYRITLTVYDSEGHYSIASDVIWVQLDEENPIDETDEGWDVWISDEVTFHIYPIGLLFGGMVLMVLARWGPEWPIITRRGRAVIGGLMVTAASYWFLFSEHAIVNL
jgi:hypothetical protein